MPLPPAILAASWTIGPIELVAILLLAGALVALVVALRGGAAVPGRSDSMPTEDTIAGRAAAEELRTLIVEARALSDELAEQFDQRSEELRRLMAQAERMSRQLPLPSAEQELKPQEAPPAALPPGPPTVAEAESIAMPVRGRHDAYSEGHEPDPIAREIYRLSDAGLPPVEIASRLGQHTGKVELILALRR
jgi:hypothetical protein